MQIDCIIIEDEPLALERVREFITKISYLNLIGAFSNAMDGIVFLKTRRVDLIFLDIEMDELNGIQLLESLTQTPRIVITTAFEQYALKGYEFNITDYLLKPFQLDRFLKAVEKVYLEMDKDNMKVKDFFFVKTEYRIDKIFFRDIFYIEGMSDYRSIVMEKRKVLTLQNFSELENIIPKDKLCRVHKSYIVSIDKIESIERSRIKIKDKLIPISETYRNQFYSIIGMGDSR